jgi:hypothetical protein
MPVYLSPVSAGAKKQLIKVEAPTVFYPFQKHYNVTHSILVSFKQWGKVGCQKILTK